MGNIYGVANPAAAPLLYGTAAGADVALTPAGTEVTIITTGALVAPSAGNWFPQIWLTVAHLSGATAPTALQFAFKIGAGSDVATFVVAPAMLANNGTITIAIPLIGVASGTAWVGTGSTINITGTATTTASTVKGVGTIALVQLVRGNDF